MANEWRVEAYRTESGESPAQTFLDGLEKGGRHRDEALALIALLRERGNELRRPHSAALGGGLFELR